MKIQIAVACGVAALSGYDAGRRPVRPASNRSTSSRRSAPPTTSSCTPTPSGSRRPSFPPTSRRGVRCTSCTRKRRNGCASSSRRPPHRRPPRRTREARKVGDFYRSFMDEARIEALKMKPLAAEFAAIDRIKDKSEIPAALARLKQIGILTPVDLDIDQDKRNSTVYAAYLSQAGLGLPDRDYYLDNDDARIVGIRKKYGEHVETMMAMDGQQDGKTGRRRHRGVRDRAGEDQLDQGREPRPGQDVPQDRDQGPAGLCARIRLERLSCRDRRIGQGQRRRVVPGHLSQGLRGAVREDAAAGVEGVSQVESAARLRRASSTRPSSTSTSLSTEPRCTASRRSVRAGSAACRLVDDAIGEALGQVYVAKYFPPESKARMEKLVANLLAAYKQSIDGLDWMGPETKKEAHAKLAKIKTKIGYPAKWRDYSKLVIKPDDLVGNVMRANQFEFQRNLDKLGKPIDRDEWFMTPQTVNAYYNPNDERDRVPCRLSCSRPTSTRPPTTPRTTAPSARPSATRSATASTTRAASTTATATCANGGPRTTTSASTRRPRRWSRSSTPTARCRGTSSTAS